MEKLYEDTKRLLMKAGKILIISHRRPDADTLGAAIALKIWLKNLQKEVVTACYDKPAAVFGFLPYINEFVSEFDLKQFDLMIVVDAGASYMTNFQVKYDDLFTSGIPVINIDHHASNDNYGTINMVDPKASSVTTMIYWMFKEWNVVIDKDVALCLLAGIYSDTGAFMHANTTEQAYKAAADLMSLGAKIADINQNLFKTKTVDTLRLWGKALELARVTDNNVALSVMGKEDYEAIHADPDQLSGVIDYLNMVPGVDYAVLLTEDRKGNVKGSFRTKKDSVDLSQVAAKFGGGGHPKAAGFCLPGKLKSKINYEIVYENDEGEKTKPLDF